MFQRFGKRFLMRALLVSCWVTAVLLTVSSCAVGEPVQSPRPSAPTSLTSRSAPDQWPDETTTGVPVGTRLTPWTDDCTITEPGTVIDARRVECDLRIRTTDVVITRSLIQGNVIVRTPADGYSFTIADSEVNTGPRVATGLGNGNFTATRVNITGGSRSVNCASDCRVIDSYLHAQAGDPEGEAHLSAVRMGQGLMLLGNRIVCEGERTSPRSGCSAGLTGYGDFAPVRDNVIDGNLFQSGNASFCAFGGSTRDKPFSDEAQNIQFRNNVFERGSSGHCGILAAIEAFDSEAPGNQWINNVFEDGEALPPRN